MKIINPNAAKDREKQVKVAIMNIKMDLLDIMYGFGFSSEDVRKNIKYICSWLDPEGDFTNKYTILKIIMAANKHFEKGMLEEADHQYKFIHAV